MRRKIDNYNKYIGIDGYLYSEDGKRYSRWIDNVGYYQSVFRENGKKHYVRLHRLIALAFIPIPEKYKDIPINKLQINHKDGNKLNNNIDNLECCTNKENTQHGYDNNLYKSRHTCPIKAINKITNEINRFKSIRECAEELGLNRKTITNILKNNKTNNYNYDFMYDV